MTRRRTPLPCQSELHAKQQLAELGGTHARIDLRIDVAAKCPSLEKVRDVSPIGQPALHVFTLCFLRFLLFNPGSRPEGPVSRVRCWWRSGTEGNEGNKGNIGIEEFRKGNGIATQRTSETVTAARQPIRRRRILLSDPDTLVRRASSRIR